MGNYDKTIRACFTGYIVQAIVNNFSPLLFLTFQAEFGVSLARLAALSAFNFIIQLITDFFSAGFIRKAGWRTAVVTAHILSAAGMIMLGLLPDILPDSFAGILTAMTVYAVGGGLLEVIISPVVENCPTENKEKTMSMLHSFYCWGQAGVILVSTLFFALSGIKNWRILSYIWAMIPAVNAYTFMRVPITATDERNERISLRQLMSQRIFLLFVLLMICAGACEQAVSQWASAFAEKMSGITKSVGDIFGPMFFAILMGTSRTFYGKYGDKINLKKFMLISGGLCVISYVLIRFSPWPALSLAGCGLCGLSVGIMWPGTFSMAAARLPASAVMFAMLALAGDLGCAAGPALVGYTAGIFDSRLNIGIGAAVIFPLVLTAGIYKLSSLHE